MTPKTKALWGAVVVAVTSALAWLANTPPEQQDALLAPLVAIMPPTWRPQIGFWMRVAASIATVYASVQASHSGPHTPPQTDTATGEAVAKP